MKKSILISIFIAVVAAYGYGQTRQTYYYKHIENVDNNGVKTKGSGSMICITFTQNSCYISDENGYIIKSGISSFTCQNFDNKVYHYKGKKSDVLVFEFDAYSYCDNCSKQGGGANMFGKLDSPYEMCIKAINLYQSEWTTRFEYFYFNSDYSRMNKPAGNNTQVYVKSAAPEKRDSAPATFY